MNFYLNIVFFILLIELNTYSQERRYFAKTMIAGTSLTYIWDKDEPETLKNQLTWNINVGITLSKRVFSGIQVLNIYSLGKSNPMEYYNIYGLFTQYNFLRGTNHRLFAEISINKGNYNDFLHDSDFKSQNLYFSGVGFGYDLPIKYIPRLYLDISFIHYYFLNQFDIESDYTQYIIGLNYRFYEK